MSHCTTSTSTYILDKYSKSYPTFGEGSSEWQHFNNPVIRLTLDVTKAPNEELQSVRVRIIWTMNSGDANSTTEVVLEDLDLLSFSSPPSRKQQAQGLPLKAVYRDSVVGIRYLHPRDSDSNPTYRRFQVTFKTSSAVSQFIGAIRTVCPCKANPTNNTEARTGPIPPSHFPPKPQMHTSDLDQQTASHSFVSNSAVPSLLRQSVFPHTSAISSSPSFGFKSSDQPDRRTSSSPINLNTTPLPSMPSVLHMRNNASNLSQMPNDSESLIRAFQDHSQVHPSAMQTTSSLPESSPPPSSANSNCMMPPPPPPNSAMLSDADAMITSLKDATGLYDLPRDTLEKLVGDIVREDRFVHLLDNLATMWKVKGVLGS